MNYPNDFINQVIQGNCLDIMKWIPDKSIDMILTDLPFGKLTTEHSWDTPIDLNKLWGQYTRIIKDRCPIVLFGIQPYTSLLVTSNFSWFKYSMVWDKRRPGNIFVGKLRPLGYHEDILIFSNGAVANGSKRNMVYFPQMTEAEPQHSGFRGIAKSFYRKSHEGYNNIRTQRYPSSIISIPKDSDRNGLHPTQKPKKLCEYLINLYSKESDLILDSCSGSGSTLVAAINTNRRFIGIELDENYCNISRNRIKETYETF